MKNKKGWIRIIEAFVAVLLILSIILLVIEKNSFGEEPSGEIYEIENSILRTIQLNNSLRAAVLGELTLPVDSLGNSPQIVWDKILEKTPSHLTCFAKICAIDSDCDFEGSSEIKKNIYSQAIPIFANLNTYSPRQLKLFCWAKN